MNAEKVLKKYDRIVFQPEGVLTTDKHYLTCAMLSVYEMVGSDRYFGKSNLDYTSVYNNQKQISDLLLCSGKITSLFEELGIDYPVDMAYVLLGAILGIGERRDFTNIYNYFKYIDLHTPDIFEHTAMLLTRLFPDKDCRREGTIWQQLKNCYTEWLFGDELFEMCFEERPSVSGKPSFITKEQLCNPIIKTKDMLTSLKERGKQISIATLRSMHEVDIPYKRWNLTGLFQKENIVTIEDILEAHRLPNFNNPAEPDPYMFARGAIGSGFSDNAYLSGEYDELFSRTLVVSNSPVSLFAVQTLGMSFAAVVSNPASKSEKDMFRQLEADYVLDSALELTLTKQ